MIVQKYKYLLLVLSLILHSCNICSHSDSKKKCAEELNLVGYPIIPDTMSSVIIERICYSLSYNTKTRQPNWVMWQLTGNHVVTRKIDVWNEYKEDLGIEKEYRAMLSDYATSGYDRGHMCPGGDCNWNDEGRDETFLLSNMCPQNPNLNRGDWKEIEIACRRWAQKFGSIYIVCGPIFFKSQEHEKIGPNRIPVPEAFFKVILCPNEMAPKGIGFICRNTEGNRKKDFYVNSIKQVERVTGYKFFVKLDDSIKEIVFDMDEIKQW